MLILFLSRVLIPVLVVLELIAQQWLFKDSYKKDDPEWELYRQRWD